MKTIYSMLIFILAIIVLLVQCVGNELEGCDGYIQVINPVDDTTVSISQDTLFIDLFGSVESVFRHTAGKHLLINFASKARITQRYKNNNPDRGKEALIIIEELGTFQATILAIDECEKTEREEFEITITN